MRDLPLHIQNILKHDKEIKTAKDLVKQADMLYEKEIAPDVNVVRHKAKKTSKENVIPIKSREKMHANALENHKKNAQRGVKNS